MNRLLRIAAYIVMAGLLVLLAAWPEPVGSEAAEEIPEEHYLTVQEYQELTQAVDEVSRRTLESIQDYEAKMEQADRERFLQMQNAYLEASPLPHPFDSLDPGLLIGMDTDGFCFYTLPEEYEREGGCLPELVQIYAYAQCRKNMVDYPTVLAMIEAESRYQYDAGSSNCIGYMQIIPKWHAERMAELGVTDITDPYQNIAVGIDIMADLLEKYDGNYAKALTAYNCGPGGAYENYFSAGKESNGYARKVMARASEIGKELIDAAENS